MPQMFKKNWLSVTEILELCPIMLLVIKNMPLMSLNSLQVNYLSVLIIVFLEKINLSWISKSRANN
jgi:hypothetical protein